MECPSCGGRQLGRVGTGRFYCWTCCVEFSVTRAGTKVYEVDVDGNLVLLNGAGSGLRSGTARGDAEPRRLAKGVDVGP